MPPLVCPSPQQSSAFCRLRDAQVCALLRTHPVTAGMLVALGWFPGKKVALRRLRRLCGRKRIRLVGSISRRAGRPEHVYCGHQPKGDQLRHEVELTELCLRLDAGKIDRGPRVTDAARRPDAEVWVNGRLYYLELDRGSMGYAQIERRFRAYQGCPHLVLWVCPSVQRAEEFRRRAGSIREIALFTTLSEALGNPHGEVWVDYAGDRVALPREHPAGKG